MVTRSSSQLSEPSLRRGVTSRHAVRTLLVVMFLALGGLVASPASASDPMNVPADITDEADVLGSDTAAVQADLDQLRDETDMQLFVVFVDEFDGEDPVDWAQETYSLSGMGTQDALLAVAIDERQYGLAISLDAPITDAQYDDLAAAIEDELADDDWAGSVSAAVSVLSADVNGGASGSLVTWLFVGGLVLIALLLALAWMASKRRGRATASGTGPRDELSKLSTTDLNQRASGALVAIDDELKTSEQELGFAQAQFGDAATAAFTRTLADAKSKVTRAFTLRQQLDDSTPETEPQAREIMAEIIGLCADASESLAADAKTFDELRDLEARVPQVLAETTERATTLRARLAPARATLTTLAVTHPASALASVSLNADQAEQLLDAAAESVRAGEASVAAGDRGTAVAHARAATHAAAQASVLLDAVASADEDLALASSRLDGALVSIQSDLVDARTIGADDPAVGAAASRAEAAVSAAQAARAGGDALAAIRDLTAAEASLDAALAPAREDAERQDRAAALLRETLGRVESQVRAVDSFISTRKGAVGPEARTRLSEAVRLLGEARALGPVDATAALEQARLAEQMVVSAQQLAQADVSRWEDQQRGFGGSGGVGGRGGGNVGGMVLAVSSSTRSCVAAAASAAVASVAGAVAASAAVAAVAVAASAAVAEAVVAAVAVGAAGAADEGDASSVRPTAGPESTERHIQH